MKHCLLLAACLPAFLCLIAQPVDEVFNKPGTFSAGSRNTLSVFNGDGSAGKGIGAQFRVRLGQKLNSEWYFDYITASGDEWVYRNDYHIGWSLMFYPGHNFRGERLLEPYLIAGHCFDKTVIAEKGNKGNRAARMSMATQAGFGTHLNITPRFDLSLSGQYMLHFGKDIMADNAGGEVVISKKDHSHAGGHLLFTVSFNYKLFRLWKSAGN